jgi:hypothetical protein
MKLDIVQIAYHVTDIHQAALKMVDTLGAGPFFISENILLSAATHRGEATDFIHSSAYGQWGAVMVELVKQEDDEIKTPFRDMYQKDQEGLHHTAIIVDHFDDTVAHFQKQGLELATRCFTKSGNVEFGFIDATATMGHMIEIYEGSDPLLGFYQLVRSAAVDWDGSDPLR